MKKTEKIKELRGLQIEELEHRNSDLKRELLNLRFQVKTGQLKNVARIKEVKQDIARIQTILNEKF